ncbi:MULTISPECIES: FkbM family methyltransferase [Haloferax]|uniref:31-O-demethyl-FK506 methyltransferase FkbM n=1 Tax=Haloferax massiliensis TaxID=1476858 RepID=A0A0D6JV59_9EURY|nr:MULTISPECIES: FkbM family methyltransferase [Haloferax]MDS0241771.1 FkbM family methyltransferase [Haloferax sp. S2CR25]MDS0444892.1 FkbM family methyltransferase [Haloferax sp. S2CR25-2]CQR52682.1 31-O-demethyl-FK506 methyltransferase FkbM [Haloferax massiliensis]
MTFVSKIGDLLWGTPAYSVGNRLFETTVEVYLRTHPPYEFSCGEATATFRPRTFVEWNNLRHRIRDEAEVLEHVLSNVRAGDVFYDVGANMGIYACLVGSSVPDVAVVGFEPYPPNTESLRRNLTENSIDATVVERPLSDGSSEERFHLYDTLDAGAQHGSLDTRYPTGEALTSIPTTTIAGDSLVEAGRIPEPNVVKIDVQGTAPSVLMGLESSLTGQRCRLVYVEAHDNASEITTILSRFGYQISTLRVDRPNKDPTVVGRKGE